MQLHILSVRNKYLKLNEKIGKKLIKLHTQTRTNKHTNFIQNTVKSWFILAIDSIANLAFIQPSKNKDFYFIDDLDSLDSTGQYYQDFTELYYLYKIPLKSIANFAPIRIHAHFLAIVEWHILALGPGDAPAILLGLIDTLVPGDVLADLLLHLLRHGSALLLGHFSTELSGHAVALLSGDLSADLLWDVLDNGLADFLWHILAVLLGYGVAGLSGDVLALLVGNLHWNRLADLFLDVSALAALDVSGYLFGNLSGNVATVFPGYLAALLFGNLHWNLSGDWSALLGGTRMANLVGNLFGYLSTFNLLRNINTINNIIWWI